MTIIMYAKDSNGDGYVQEIGRFKNWEEIEIRTGLFNKDVVISFNVEYDKENS